MLAKENKIRTILKQRSIIEDELSQLSSRNGDPSYRYEGYIYKENIEYFEKQGYKVVLVESDILKAMLKGRPVYFFTPNDEIINLNEEEMKEAEKYRLPARKTDAEKRAKVEETANKVLNFIFGEKTPEEPSDSKDSEKSDGPETIIRRKAIHILVPNGEEGNLNKETIEAIIKNAINDSALKPEDYEWDNIANWCHFSIVKKKRTCVEIHRFFLLVTKKSHTIDSI